MAYSIVNTLVVALHHAGYCIALRSTSDGPRVQFEQCCGELTTLVAVSKSQFLLAIFGVGVAPHSAKQQHISTLKADEWRAFQALEHRSLLNVEGQV
jgi:hypothetical protein